MNCFKCKMCGGTIEFTEGATVGVCDSCGTKQTLPKTNDEVISNLHNRANTLRLKCEFDKAEEIYNKILENVPDDAEAHWGIILCKYGIEYVEDPKTYKRIPTCHRTSFEAILADEDYKAAIENGDIAQRELYEAEAKEIDRIQRDILAIVKNEKPFDVFICYKETDFDGKRTQDSVIANDIYYQLTQEGFKVFYAAITLEDKLGREYEPYIFAALNSAKVMLAVGTKPEYFTAVWVKNEWSRYLKLMKTDRKKLLIPCYKDMDAYELPEEFAHLQAQDMGKIGFINDLVRGIKKVITDSAPAAPAKEAAAATGGSTNIAPLIKRAFLFLEDGDWASANDYCEKVLDIDPENAEAYLGKLMVELKVGKKADLKNCEAPFDGSSNYQKAVRFGDTDLPQYITYINERNEKARMTEIYEKAVNAMNAAKTENDFNSAADIFAGIPGFEDADVLAEQCREKAEQAKQERLAKEEADRLEAERKAEERRIAAEKVAKKRKKIIAITTPIVCACIAFVIVLTTVIIPNSKYNSAVTLMNDEKYDEAIAVFEALNGYKDSDNQIENCNIGKYGEEKWNKINIKIGDTYTFGAYEQDNSTSNGKEAIEWTVLDKDGMSLLLVSKQALDCQQYNTSFTDVTWESCSLRKWMNGTFLNNAFSAGEQAQIQNTNVSADENPYSSTNPGNATTDKVFLLSITEAEKYFTTDEARKCAPTAYAKAQGAYTSDIYKTASGEATCYWWLRSPGRLQDYAAYVRYDGSVDCYGSNVDNVSGCVRPALWINLDA